MVSRSLLTLALSLLLVFASGERARAQELDRATTPDRRATREAPPARAAPVASSTRRGPRVIDEGELDLSLFPDRIDAKVEPTDEEGSGIEFDHGGKAWIAGGYDSNVFRSDRGQRHDAFGQTHGEVELLLKFPQGGELYLEIAGESLAYLEREKANEHFVAAFMEYYQVATSWLEVGAQNTLEFSRLNLLDDTGDLLPRGRFGSVDEEPRVFALFRPGDPDSLGEGGVQLRDLSFEVGASYRFKDYDENTGLDSLDYEEQRFDASIRYRVARRPSSRVKLKYRFRRRDYRQLRARERDSFVGPGSPHLALERHQLNLRWTQQLIFGSVEGRVVADVGATYNRDTHTNDRSYRELSASLTTQWWPIKNWTRLDAGARVTSRNFLARRPSNRSGHLRHRLLRLRLGAWQALVKADDTARVGETPVLAVFSNASYTIWRSGDFREDYDRLVFNAGLEFSW